MDVEKEIATLTEVKALGYSLPTYEKLKLQQIVSNDLSTISNEDLSTIETEIEDGLK